LRRQTLFAPRAGSARARAHPPQPSGQEPQAALRPLERRYGGATGEHRTGPSRPHPARVGGARISAHAGRAGGQQGAHAAGDVQLGRLADPQRNRSVYLETALETPRRGNQDPHGELIAGTPRLPAPPERLAPEAHVFYDAKLEGERVRVAARAVKFEPGIAIVQVAETLVKRDKLVLELLVASTVPQLLIAFAA